MPKTNLLINVEGDVEVFLNSISQERANGITDHVFKSTDVVFMPKTEFRTSPFSSNDVSEYLTVLGAKVTRDFKKANVILGYRFENYLLRHYTWGDAGPIVSWSNYEQMVKQNYSYVKNGVTKTDAKVLGVRHYAHNNQPYEYPNWYDCVEKGVFTSHWYVDEYTLAINTHIINDPSVVLISNVRPFIKAMNKHFNAGKRPFTSDDKNKALMISTYEDDTVLEMMRMGYDNIDLSNDLDFFVELFYSRNITTQARQMFRRLFKRNEGMTAVLSVRRNYDKAVDENGVLCQVAQRAKAWDIPVDFNNIINSWIT